MNDIERNAIDEAYGQQVRSLFSAYVGSLAIDDADRELNGAWERYKRGLSLVRRAYGNCTQEEQND